MCLKKSDQPVQVWAACAVLEGWKQVKQVIPEPTGVHKRGRGPIIRRPHSSRIANEFLCTLSVNYRPL